MRWTTAGLCALCLMTMTGCPEEFGKEGRIQRAAHQDALELIQKQCTRADFERYCEGGREASEKCREVCG